MFNAEQWGTVKSLIRAKETEKEFKPADIASAVTGFGDAERVRQLCREIVGYTATYPIDGRQLFESQRSRGGFWWFDADEEDIKEAERIARMPDWKRMPRNPLV